MFQSGIPKTDILRFQHSGISEFRTSTQPKTYREKAMGIENLMGTVKSRLQESTERDRAKAEFMIAEHSDQDLRKWFPSLFDGEYPIKKWVVIEPGAEKIGCDSSWSMAAVLGEGILLYGNRNSYCYQITVAKYERGSDDCWAKKPSTYKWKELRNTPQSNEENLAKMIESIKQSDQ